MENATKALLMAGSVLIALLIIGLAQFMFNRISDREQTKIDADEVRRTSDYLASFEQYNKKTLYGSEILSLANLQDDYNRTQSDTAGYSRVTITVDIKTSIEKIDGRSYYLTEGRKDITDLVKALTKKSGRITSTSSLESDIEEYGNDTNNPAGKTIKYLSQINIRELAVLLGVTFSSSDDAWAIREAIGKDYGKLLNDIDKYENLKRSYTQFKTTQFRCIEVKYDNIGRIKEMRFEEIVPEV